ncbi:Modifier of mdg4 [Operophtera brumata]|uniref:Modifier of mdg4 n=1 Tax=Operophtera brumata TaxID=104452 RepID=A0A0L7KIS5_OPEBR|nr:Modifier of mdg4 [Operophtera brumata]
MQGYQYSARKNPTNSRSIKRLWRCCSHSIGCRAVLYTIDDIVICVRKTHTHPPKFSNDDESYAYSKVNVSRTETSQITLELDEDKQPTEMMPTPQSALALKLPAISSPLLIAPTSSSPLRKVASSISPKLIDFTSSSSTSSISD